MSEIQTISGAKWICRLPDGEPQGLKSFDFGDGTRGLLAKVDDKIYLIDVESGTCKELKVYE